MPIDDDFTQDRDTADRDTAGSDGSGRGTEEIAAEETVASHETDQDALKDSIAGSCAEKPSLPGYELKTHLGAGSFGEVWSAVQKSTGHTVAVKILKKAKAGSISSLEREVRRLASVSEHPHVITLVDANLLHTPPFMVTPYIPDSLGAHAGKPAQNVAQVVEWFKEIAGALLYMHGKGILHCDLKPGNILLGEEGEARIVDFGQAHILGEEGQSFGTLWYMAPEQALIPAGEREKVLPDICWDVYSLGATIYYLLTGHLPRSTEKARESLSRERDITTCLASYADELKRASLVPVRDLNPLVDDELSSIVGKCLQLDIHDRYRTMGDILDDLRRRESHLPLTARPRTPGYVFSLFLKRNARLLIVSGALLCVLTGVLVNSFIHVTSARDMARRAQGETQRRLARMEFERGLNLAQEGAPGAVLWMIRALRDDSSSQEYRFAAESHLQTEAALKTIIEQPAPATSACFDREGRKILTTSEDMSARLWNAATGKPLTAPLPHGGMISTARFSPDNHWIITASDDGSARLWDSGTGKLLRQFTHKKRVNCAAISPDGKKAVTAGDDRTARIWNAVNGSLLRSLPHRGRVFWASFSPDGKRIVTASGNHRAQLWDVAEGKKIGAPMNHRLAVFAAVFSSDGRKIVTASKDWTARIWDGKTGKPVCHPLLHSGTVNSASFSADGTLVLTTSDDLTARVWNAKTGKPLGSPLSHKGRVGGAEFSPDGTMVITASDDWTSQLWDTRTCTPVLTRLLHWGAVRTACFSPDGQQVVTASSDRTVKVRDIDPGRGFTRPVMGEECFTRVTPDEKGERLALCFKGEAVIWGIREGKPLLPPLRHRGKVNDAVFSPDGRLIITAGEDRVAGIWNGENGEPLKGSPLAHDNAVALTRISLDGTKILSIARGGTWYLHDSTAFTQPYPPVSQGSEILDALFSPDGTKILTCLRNNSANLWNSSTGIAIGAPLHHKREVNHGAFSPDGRIVATASSDSTVGLWDSTTGQPLLPPIEFRYPVHYVSFSPDGKRLATACDDGAAQIWETAGGKPLSPRMRHGNVVNTVIFSPDGRWVVTSSWNGARIWDPVSGSPVTPWIEKGRRIKDARFIKDNRHILTLDEDGHAALRSFSFDEDLPPELIEKRAEELTGLYLDGGGNVCPIDASGFEMRRRELAAAMEKHRKTCTSPARVLWRNGAPHQ